VEPLIVLVVVFGATLIVTALRRRNRHPDVALSLRLGVGAMFVLSGVSHFVGMRAAMIAMVPDGLPAPDLIVTVTGVLELAAAIAMASRRLAPVAAVGLTALLIAMYPANVALALSGTDVPFTDTLGPRTLIQLVFLAATIGLAIVGFTALRRERTAKRTRDGERNRASSIL
jgi:uncharacterized membrane protein